MSLRSRLRGATHEFAVGQHVEDETARHQHKTGVGMTIARSWDKRTRRIGVNARLFDDFVAADAAVVVIDGKYLW
jgi:hypothetical protein